MSADDFQTKYASVMESMLKTAVAETTKLFETMVDELKAEISIIKKENEDLKTRCIQFEKAKSQVTVHTGESEPLLGPRDGSERRDAAVQCDHVPFRTVLVEQCQPLRLSSWQNQEQQSSYDEMEYSRQWDHDYEKGNYPVSLVKKEEEVEPTVVCRQGLSDNADSPQTSACGTETEGLLINQECSNGEITLPQKDEETRVAMKPPCLGKDSNLQAVQKQLSEPEPSQVISLPAVKYDTEEDSGVDLKISEIRTQGKLITSAEQPLSEVEPHEEERPSLGKTSNKQIYVTVQQCTGVHSTEEQLAEPTSLNKEVAYEVLKSVSTEVEASSKPVLSVCRRRGRPPKKSKRLQQPVKEILQSSSTDVSTEQEVLQAASTEVTFVNETLNTPAAETVQAPSVQPRECSTSVTLQDAMLLVEAMDQSTVKITFSSPQRMGSPQIQCAPRVVTLQTADEVQVQLPTPGSLIQTPPLPDVTHEVAVDLHVTELSTTPQSTIEIPCNASQTTDATESNKAHSHIKVAIPQHVVTSNTATPPSSSTAATQTSVSFKQHPLHPLITLAEPSKPLSKVIPNKIIVVPRKVSPLMPHTISVLSPTQLSTVATTVADEQNSSSLPASTAAGLPLGKTSLSAVVKLSRLPFPTSTKESVLISRLFSDGSSEGTMQEKTSSVVSLSKVPSLSTDIYPTLKETVSVSVHASQMSEDPNDQEKASLSSETCSILDEATIAVSPTQSSVLSGTASESTSNLDEEIVSNVVQGCMLPNDPPLQDKESAAFIHLTSFTSKDIADPHLQMTKAQFLAQLAVKPVVQASRKASTNDCADTRAFCSETSPVDKRKLQQSSLVARLRSHLKTHMQAGRTKTDPELLTETKTPPVTSKKLRLENVSQKERNTDSESIPVSPNVDDTASLKNTTNDITSMNPRRSGLCEDGVRSKGTVSEPTSVSCRSKLTKNSTDPKKANIQSTPMISSFARDCVDPPNTKSTSVSPRRSNSTKNVQRTSTKTTFESPRQCRSISLSPRRTSSTRDRATPKKTKSASPRRSRAAREDASPKKTNSTSVRGKLDIIKNGTSPKMSTSQLTHVSLRRYMFTKDGSHTKQIKRESNSFSPRRYSNTTDGDETGTSNARWPKLAEDGANPRKTEESTPAKRPTLIEDGTIPKKSLRLVNADKLDKVAKLKISNQSILQNGAKTSHLEKNGASCEAVKRCKTKAVWIPPIMPVSETTRLAVKKETRSPRSNNHTVVYPPSVSLHSIPIRRPPIVSPLQPLLVIGRCLLKNQCGECGRVLSSSAALESHVRHHTGHRPFSCTLCGKSFPDSKGFKRHGRVHRNGRIHICQQCGKGFVYRFGLTKHLQMVHGKIRPFVCQICSKAFFTKRDVETHIRIHTGEKPYHCELCERRFARRVELNVHLRWHNGEKRHWCPYCGKGFLDSNNLKRHKYVHTGEKPLSCPHCPKNFKQSGHLKKHIKNVHKIQ
ncbi:hypothetical protein PAMP_020544 [Pampus punctatissimus]